MTAHPPRIGAPSPTLEEIELELALGIQDMMGGGFANALDQAARVLDGELMFDMPIANGTGVQRAAAMRIGAGLDEHVLLIMLSEDGMSVSVEDAGKSDQTFADLALSHVSVMHHLAAIASFAPAEPVPA